jgi:DNA-binding CsgD family transcriptional regulator
VYSRVLIIAVLVLQAVCAAFFVFDISLTLFGLSAPPINWQLYEFIEIGATAGLALGVVVGALALRDARTRTRRAETALRAASGAFMDVLEERFIAWGLTPAERDVALFAIKGMSTAEIAGLRDTSEGTVKAQTNAIYRKAGVSGRPQLLSLFIDDLMDPDGPG